VHRGLVKHGIIVFLRGDMFQLKGWNEGVVHRQGATLQISVPRPREAPEVLLGLIVLFMAYGFFNIFFVPLARIAAPRDFFRTLVPALVFALPMALTFQRLFEQKCSAQIVTVNRVRISWTRKTRLWTRTRHLTLDKITKITASREFPMALRASKDDENGGKLAYDRSVGDCGRGCNHSG
jgi:hypothetical protein